VPGPGGAAALAPPLAAAAPATLLHLQLPAPLLATPFLHRFFLDIKKVVKVFFAIFFRGKLSITRTD
jgi:hypothetical protein